MKFEGDNIISSRGDVWRQYKSVIKPGIQNSLAIDVLVKNAGKLCHLIRREQITAKKAGIAVQEILQRYTIAVTAEALFQTDMHVSAYGHRNSNNHVRANDTS